MISLDEALADGRGIERPFNCPVHNDRTASASVNITNGLWYCFACHAKGEAANYVPDAKHLLARLNTEDDKPRTYPMAWLDVFDIHHSSEYWSTRYSPEVAAKYRCGTDPETGFPTYPLMSRTALYGVVLRTDTDPKYLYPSGVSVSTMLFTSPVDTKPNVVVLVEGAGDVMALDHGGLPDGWMAAGTYGSGLHGRQRELVMAMSPKLLVFAFDGDNAGHRAIEAASAWCEEIGLPFVSYPWDNVSVKDAGELEQAERIPVLTQAVKENGYGRYC